MTTTQKEDWKKGNYHPGRKTYTQGYDEGYVARGAVESQIKEATLAMGIKAGRTAAILEAVEVCHLYAMKTKDTAALDLIEQIQRHLLTFSSHNVHKKKLDGF